MTEDGNASVVDAAQNLSEKSVELVNETSAWISGNILDILIASSVWQTARHLMWGPRKVRL